MSKRWTWVAAAGLLLVGGLFGAGVQSYADTRHRQGRAVMTLAQFHLTQLQRAVEARDCARVDRERTTLVHMKAEIDQAFPLAYSQDVNFRDRSEALKKAVMPVEGTAAASAQPGAVIPVAAGSCPSARPALDAARLACADCHREYR